MVIYRLGRWISIGCRGYIASPAPAAVAAAPPLPPRPCAASRLPRWYAEHPKGWGAHAVLDEARAVCLPILLASRSRQRLPATCTPGSAAWVRGAAAATSSTSRCLTSTTSASISWSGTAAPNRARGYRSAGGRSCCCHGRLEKTAPYFPQPRAGPAPPPPPAPKPPPRCFYDSPALPPAEIREVLIVDADHLHEGYHGQVTDVNNRYFDVFWPRAMNIARELKSAGNNETYSYTTFSC